MAKSLRVSGVDVVRKLKRLGFEEVGSRGSHIYLAKPAATGIRVTVPVHGKSKILPPKTLSSILNAAGVTEDELRNA